MSCKLQILIWWFTTKATNNNNIFRQNGNGANVTQNAAASLCEEIVTLWRLAALNPKLSPIQRDDLCLKFQEWHLSTVEKVKKAQKNISGTGNNNVKRNEVDNFLGFKPSMDACALTWDDYIIPGVTYSEKEGLHVKYRFNKHHENDKKPSRIQPVTVCSESIISTDNNTTLAQAHNILQEQHHNSQAHHHGHSSPRDSLTNDGAISSGSEGFCEPERSSSLFRDSDSGSEMKDINSRSNSVDDQDLDHFSNLSLSSNHFPVNKSNSASNFVIPQDLDVFVVDSEASNRPLGVAGAASSHPGQAAGLAIGGPQDEYSMYFYKNVKPGDTDKLKTEFNGEEPVLFSSGARKPENVQDVCVSIFV